ncbi:transglutaminase domain-containing protein [Flavobacterium urocaniciphilum]|uniref:Transglutaminase-like superfamily protein n=1 Tax=Flavobacterium urocaniciphilum TaxID=1299341 RepID=A0A1H8Z9N5_9FLAO|nr:transglutaminase domain-containing protein [Flavobacterium urocaniciphilum]SEP60967.1 Transglutaminase-like superfamily protein [Flavobacterium urocaniciphilum]
MKKLILGFLFVTNFIFAQQNYSGVVDLLVSNKREEARKLFDKQFGKTKNTSIDLLFLDALIDVQNGKLYFDESLLKGIENLPNSQYYIDPFINENYVLTNINDSGYDDLTYKKIDFLANSPKFKDKPIVIYRKAVADRNRYKFNEATAGIDKLNVITNWQFCGVFENLNGSGINTEYEPEVYAKNDKLFDANSNGMVGWYVPTKYTNEGYHFFYNEAEYGDGIDYAQTFVTVPESKTYILSFGCSSAIKIFVNDVEVIQKEETGKTNLDAFNIKVNLKKGVNRILVKIEQSGSSYFSVNLKNTDYSKTNFTYSNSYLPYNTSTIEELAVEEINLDFENYFQNLVKQNPDNLLYKFYLFKAYTANEKKDLALDVIDGLDKKYPNSTFIQELFVLYYGLDGDSQKIEEINKNIESVDKDYFGVTLGKINDQDWLSNSDIKVLEEYSKKSEKYLSPFCKIMFDFLIASRKSDKNGMVTLIEKLSKESYGNQKFNLLCTSIKYRLNNDKDTYISELLNMTKNYENLEAENLLVEYYEEINDKEKIKEYALSQINRYYFINSLRSGYINTLLKDNKYDEALKFVDENLGYFPYSYKNFEEKATIYSLQKKNAEAEKFYLKALSHDSANSSLRKKLHDLTNKKDEIELIETTNIYDFIKKKRNITQLKGDYGVQLLLDEYLVNILDSGSRKTKIRLIYEVLTESGIESLKEYSLNTYGVNLVKSEIVKKNGSLVPAEDSGDTLVFSNLEVGDVIYIEYDYFSNSYGRFYKDFYIDYAFNGAYPALESIFSIIHTPDLKYQVDIKNGNVPMTEKKLGNKVVRTWKRSNTPAIPTYESVAPNYSDVTNVITLGTISSWKDIANWYSDLVKKNIKFDKVTQNAYNQIFPNGTTGLTETQRAEKIYRYICDNITYSFLDFRQSGYVPQKPSKTITSKLGDCKDLSTLFVTLAEKAGLKANLVLVLTNDNGLKTLPLPSKEFNHCIAKVMLEGKEHYLEMTDKFLPFKAIPPTLYKANALVISFDKAQNENVKLISIPADNAIKNVRSVKTVVDIQDDKKLYTNTHYIKGAGKSYINELFSSSTTEEVRKGEFEENYNQRLNKTISFQEAKCASTDKFSDSVEFSTKFQVNEKLQQLGSLKVVSVPFIEVSYTKDLVNSDTRNYDIYYASYETTNEYQSEILMNIAEGKKFIEIPESKTLSFKNHKYVIEYNLLKNNQLQVKRNVQLDWSDISKTDYLEFKKYVEDILAIEEQIIGFK